MSAEQQKPCPDNRTVVSGLQDVLVVCVSLAVVSIVALVALAVH
jgi:hypothetical protein